MRRGRPAPVAQNGFSDHNNTYRKRNAQQQSQATTGRDRGFLDARLRLSQRDQIAYPGARHRLHACHRTLEQRPP